jgi:hypothetical protein
VKESYHEISCASCSIRMKLSNVLEHLVICTEKDKITENNENDNSCLPTETMKIPLGLKKKIFHEPLENLKHKNIIVKKKKVEIAAEIPIQVENLIDMGRLTRSILKKFLLRKILIIEYSSNCVNL